MELLKWSTRKHIVLVWSGSDTCETKNYEYLSIIGLTNIIHEVAKCKVVLYKTKVTRHSSSIWLSQGDDSRTRASLSILNDECRIASGAEIKAIIVSR